MHLVALGLSSVLAIAILDIAIRTVRRRRALPKLVLRHVYELRLVGSLVAATRYRPLNRPVVDPLKHDLTGLRYRACRCVSLTCPHWRQVRPGAPDRHSSCADV